jgi:amino acid adenylation domain-containing protein
MSDHVHRSSADESDVLDEVREGRVRTEVPDHPHRLVELHAAATPHRAAVKHRDRELTFGELNRRANRLAHFLATRGVGPGSRVVVCLEPGFDIVVSLLAILKAGATYVPLDPTHPAAHTRAIMEDTRPSLIIATRRMPADVAPHTETLFIDESAASLATFPAHDPALGANAEATAYVHYTSGTTGKPKGVVASYANLAWYVAAARQRYGFTNDDVMPAIARFSLSISMFELLTALSAGGALVVLDRDHVLDPVRLAETIRRVTVFHAGPSLLRPLLDHIRAHYADLSVFDGVRHASSGGDLVPPEVLESAKDVFRKAEVFVIYGCSEIACMGCTYEVPRDRHITKTLVGRPFDGMSVRIVDEALNQMPVGEVGEICFSGAGVATGYLQRDALTAARFVHIEGRRFYRTGDMGRVTDDGFVQILGRADFQAKIRGMRVELGEVEYHLRSAPRVKDGVVMPRDGADGEKILVAYVVLQGSTAPHEGTEPSSAAAIRRHMVEHLPDYMVPAIYVELPTLPLSHNMKVDRRALPAPTSAPARLVAFRAPETASERALAEIWERLLPVDDVGLDDNFFELGGHSLLAARFLVDVERALGVRLDGMDLLRESLEVLARTCDERLGYARAEPVRATALAPGCRVQTFHFGPGQGLYGVLTSPLNSHPVGAVLVCAPVGQESVRAHFVLSNFAKRLAARRIASLQFDYYGTGDSLGESADASCTRWREDIAAACAELVRRTGATRVTAVGVRFGATLLAQVAAPLALARIVFWDPVTNGSEHVLEMIRMHRAHLRATKYASLFRPRRNANRVELLGTTYSASSLDEARSLTVAASPPAAPLKWLVTSPSDGGSAAFERIAEKPPGSRVERLDVDCGWSDPGRLDELLPDVGIAASLVTLCTEQS